MLCRIFLSFKLPNPPNIAPTTDVVVIRDGEEGRTGSLMRWGLIPWWFKGPGKLPLLHNARSETVHEKKLFKASFRRQRCLIPPSGFYDGRGWLTAGSSHSIFPRGTGLRFPLLASGIAPRQGGEVDSRAILTTDCNAFMQPIHDRMPMVLSIEDWDTWLCAPMPSTDEVLLPLLKPFAPDLMQLWAVSSAVGRVSNQGEELIRPVSLCGSQRSMTP